MVSIEKWFSVHEQTSQIGDEIRSVARLIELSKSLEVFDAPLNCLDLYKKYDVTMREFVMHMNAILAADLNYPIIIGEDGEILDGRHRIMKALHLGLTTVKAVRFDKNPPPCRYKSN